MAQPQAYNREVDFTERDGDDTNHAGINAELDAAALSINEIRDNLALIQRDDGGLQAGIVTAESLAPSAFDAVLDEVNEATLEAQTAANQATLAASTAVSARNTATGAASAAGLSASNAAASAAGAATAAQTLFNGLYLGSRAADPTVDLNGQPLTDGDFYYNNVAKLIRTYDASVPGWVNATPAGQFKRIQFSAGVHFTPGTTTSLPLPTDPGPAANVFVTFNGVSQHLPGYTVQYGSTVVFGAPIPTGTTSIEVSYIEAVFSDPDQIDYGLITESAVAFRDYGALL